MHADDAPGPVHLNLQLAEPLVPGEPDGWNTPTDAPPGLPAQAASFVVTPETYRTQIAPARTFCFFEEIEQMRRMNLIQGAIRGHLYCT